MRQRLEDEATPIEEITAGIDQEGCRGDLGGWARNGVPIKAVEPGMPHNQTWWAQLRCQELLEPQSRRIAAPGELGHEHNAALLDQLGERFKLGQVACQRQAQ